MQFSQGPCHNERQRLSLQHHHTLPCVRPICYVSTMWPLRRLGGGVGSKSLSRVESVLDFSCICCLAFYPRCQVYGISSCHHVPLTLQRKNKVHRPLTTKPASHKSTSTSHSLLCKPAHTRNTKRVFASCSSCRLPGQCISSPRIQKISN